ncbi:thrombospondin type 3 repeat-containing protein, partial [Vibrio alfacsensis]|uniref:thrombospondin type 3 repeat-containing protein n=1 Tax=Vibrio alfacsensis TaxID=1074311 RepID=UPI004067D4CB
NADAFPEDASEIKDTDGDGVGDNADAFPEDASEIKDTDGDGVGDNADAFPEDASEIKDTDGDGVGDNADAFPEDASEIKDTDGDGVGDNADAFPEDASEIKDTDGDGVGDNADAFPEDASEIKDTDGDGVGDNADAFPEDASETKDTDGDGVGDNADAFPEDASETKDTDGDGVGDNADAFPEDASETKDTDGDGVGDNADAFPEDASETKDTDGDGVGDNADAFPEDASETKDTDGDGVGDNSDAFPEDGSETKDTDGDGVGDNADAFPEDASETKDTDGDGVGNNADMDDDGDGFEDDKDNDPLVALEIPATLSQCIASLPQNQFPVAAVGTLNNSKLYAIERVMFDGREQSYTQTEIETGQQQGLPNGLFSDRAFTINQVTPDLGGGVDQWNPNADLEYLDALDGAFYGSHDTYYRWWSFVPYYHQEVTVPLNEIVTVDYIRVNKWNPKPEDPTINADATSLRYQGKDILNVDGNLVEVCVSGHDGEYVLESNDPTSELVPVYLTESVTNYSASKDLVVKSERQYLEYATAERVEPNWGWSSYTKQLQGFVNEGQLFGQDPIASRVPEGEFTTLKQCLASLDGGEYQPQVGDVNTYYMSRSKYHGEDEHGQANFEDQSGMYEWHLLVDDNASWHDKHVRLSQLMASRYDELAYGYVPWFSENYYETQDKEWLGIEGFEPYAGNDIKWGSKTTEAQSFIEEHYYRLPKVTYSQFEIHNPETQYGADNDGDGLVDWRTGNSNASATYVGKVTLQRMDQETYEIESVEACQMFSYSTSEYFDVNGHPLPEMNEWRKQLDSYDNKGLIWRQRSDQRWDFEDWQRDDLSLSYPE